MSAPTLRLRLLAAEHVVLACRYCGRHLAADTTYAGAPLPAAARRYCSRDCRDTARGRRAELRTAPTRRHLARHADLIHRHEQEDAGQLPLTDDPLPAIPPLETP